MNNNITITKKERLIHTLFFEIFGLMIIGTISFIFAKDNMLKLTGFGIFMSFVAMAWNYFYNIGFDKFFGTDRINRKISTRLIHGLFFEIGLILVSNPILMYILKLGFFEVLMLNISISFGYLVYAIVYNWSFDQVKHRYFTKK